ncbi:MAG: YpdA family putative bacillithiol disulfide reductase [Vicinamibacteria bacterium]|jgi:thioredoxin reductase (NADPH)|nr:YpdA family putative bacillithiol disulfide reductase [Vicinamibacteria bacterium]
MLDLAIVGAGPAGLATAIAAREAGLRALVIDKGLLVNSIFHFPRNQVFFTTPELLEIGGLPFVTPYEKPTRVEALRYYRRVADHFGLDMKLGRRVLSIDRGDAGFVLQLGPAAPPSGFATAAGPDLHPDAEPAVEALPARNVVIATGYYDTPNRLGVPGEDLPHVAHYYAEAHAYYQQRVVVVGGKNSAALAALDLHRHGAHVTLVHRGLRLSDSVKYWIKPDIENRIRQGAIAARFGSRVIAIHPDRVETETADALHENESLPADAVFLLTGYRPDPRLLRSVGVEVDAATARPRHDEATFETNVGGLFVAGSIVSGSETNRTFIENGRFHGERIVATIVARRA